MDRSDMRFAVFIDDTLRSYSKSGEYRAALHSEAPGAPPADVTICPPEHRHSKTPTCYAHHGCRCSGCREEQSRRSKRNRMRAAQAKWREQRRTA